MRILIAGAGTGGLPAALSPHDAEYERFHHGAPHVYLPGIVRDGSPEALEALTLSCLDGYDLRDEPAAAPGGVHGLA
ncbi:hypothetical protein ACLIYM_04495 [Streptomyces fenghuangensis]